MAVGTINSPATWINGTVVAPSWTQNVQDTVNNLYAFKGATTYSWLRSATPTPSANWTASATGTELRWTCTNTAGSLLVFPVTGIVGTSSTVRMKVTSVIAHVNQAAASGMGLQLIRWSGASSAGAVTATVVGTATGTAASGHQILTISSINTGADNDAFLEIGVSAVTVNDYVIGVRVTYDMSLYI